MEIKEIFENRLKIENKVMSIESLFNNEDRLRKTNYKPSYQRNYVWDDEKATYFIESILLGTEIPPLIYFRNKYGAEIVDGRQRYETILRFINGQFKLKRNGLQKLENIEIANKFFKDIPSYLQDLFWDTKLRLIEFSFHSPNLIDEEMEELVKREIFKRYNSGITPLKPTEIANAVYIGDDLNSYIKQKLQIDKILFRDVSTVLHFEKTNHEIILKKIRQLLVQHKIPIKYYAVKKDTVISKFYEFLFSDIEESEIEGIFTRFIQKINLLSLVRSKFTDAQLYNRLMSECLFWAFSILETEKGDLSMITKDTINELVSYLMAHINSFAMDRSSFYRELFTRYEVTSDFFSERFGVDFHLYLHNNLDFKKENKEITPSDDVRVSFDELRINKPEPSSIAIVDICRLMTRQRFLIRPPYQRNEVINKKKSSSIIESILLGIKLPPIFVYKRADDISEVLDGQQRLLSILGFIQKPYLDENNKMRSSDKDGFALNLKNNILYDLNGKKFEQLTPEDQDKILNFDLYIIEISHKNNPNFEPIDLFIRLNNKPYPIKEETFEMWNSYISRDIIDTIKEIHNNHHGWFYIRKNNSRMENENIYTSLAYFQLSRHKLENKDADFPNELDIYKVVNKIYFRVRSKNEITKVLEKGEAKSDFIKAANELEFSFIKKVKILLTDLDSSVTTLNKNLDDIFRVENGRRTQQNLYALWYFLFDIPLLQIELNKLAIRKSLKSLFADMAKIESKELFDSHVFEFKRQYRIEEFSDVKSKSIDEENTAILGEISMIITGTNKTVDSISLFHENYSYLQKGAELNYEIRKEDLKNIQIDPKEDKKIVFEAKEKILLNRTPSFTGRFRMIYTESKVAFSQEIIGISVSRHGFQPKFVAAFLSSKYCYKRFLATNSSTEDINAFPVNFFKQIHIPVLSLSDQHIFEFLFDRILESVQSRPITLFYERLLDAMVYETIFIRKFQSENIAIIKHVREYITNSANDLDFQSTYNILSDPAHPIALDFLKIISVPEIQEFE